MDNNSFYHQNSMEFTNNQVQNSVNVTNFLLDSQPKLNEPSTSFNSDWVNNLLFDDLKDFQNENPETEIYNQDHNLVNYIIPNEITSEFFGNEKITEITQENFENTINLHQNINPLNKTSNTFINETSSSSDPQLSPLINLKEDQPKKNESLIKNTSQCHVCNDNSGNHKYYGGNACNSCRAFFRRSVKNEVYIGFVCLNNGICEINSKSWKSCKYCRFQKCLECGMRISRVTIESSSNSRESKIKSKKKSSMMLLMKKPNELFTMEDEVYTTGMKETAIKLILDNLAKHVLKDLDLMELLFMQFANQMPLNTEMLKIHEKSLFFSLNEFFGSLNDTCNISNRDRISLMRANFPSAICYFYSLSCDSDNFKRIEPMFKQYVQQYVNPHNLDSKYKYVGSLWNWSGKAVSYEQLFPPNWTNNVQIAHRHKELCYKVKQWGRISPNFADENLVFLLGVIILFSPESVKLDNPKSVENLQKKFTILLSKYLKTNFKHQSSTNTLGNGCIIKSYCRELSEIRQNHENN